MTPLPDTMDQNDPNATDASRAVGGDDEPPQPTGGVPVELDITDVTGRVGAAALAWLERFGALALAEAVGDVGGVVESHAVSLSVVDDTKMSELHLFHSGIAGTTDVLTFDLRDNDSGALDVEIVVCLDEADREAAGRGRAVERELLLYLLHGSLHCLGYDDHGGEDYERMHAREDEILAAIGVGSVFGGSFGDGEGAR